MSGDENMACVTSTRKHVRLNVCQPGVRAAHPAEAHRIESQGMLYMGRSADAREGVQSFLEKRPAKFTMRPSKDMPPWFPWWK